MSIILFLGSKGPSKSQDVPDLKPLPPLKPLSSSTSKKMPTSLPDRKRDCPSPLQPLRLAKQRKTLSPHSPSVSIDIESSLKSSTSSPVPSIAPIDGKYSGLEFEKNQGKASLSLNVTKFFRASRPVHLGHQDSRPV